jgi:hypothetical protein
MSFIREIREIRGSLPLVAAGGTGPLVPFRGQSAIRNGKDEPPMDTERHGWDGLLLIRVHPRSSVVQIRNLQSAIMDSARRDACHGGSRCHRDAPQSAIRNSPIVPGQTQSNRVKPGQTGSNPVKVLFKLYRRGKAPTGLALCCGFSATMHNGWWLAPAAGNLAGRQFAIGQSSGVKPSQTQSNRFPQAPHGVLEC